MKEVEVAQWCPVCMQDRRDGDRFCYFCKLDFEGIDKTEGLYEEARAAPRETRRS